jgi:hypothetical protein
MRKQLILAVVLVAALAMPAFASVQNIKISGDVDNTFLHRRNFDLGKGLNATGLTNNGTDRIQNVFFTQSRLRADADLSDNVSATVALINERVWNNDNSTSSSDIDLNLAFVTLREMLYSPLTVVVGRQAFHYGNSFIIDSTGPNNGAPTDSGIVGIANDLTKQSAMDAVRAILDYNPLKLEFLFSKLNSGTANGTPDAAFDDVDLYGANATYNLGDEMNTQIEGYFFARIDQSVKRSAINSVGDKNDTVYIPGLRASTNIIEGLNVQGEVAWQRGNKIGTTSGSGGIANQRRNALGAQFIANYALPVAQEYKPTAQYVYTFVSGDKNPNDTYSTTQRSSNEWTAWDPMYENQAGGTIYNSLFSLTNAHIHSASLSAMPIEDLTIKGTWTGLWLQKEIQGTGTTSISILQPDGTSTSVTANTGEKQIGNEFDVDATYAYTEDVQIGLSLGYFNPGDLFASANDDAASQALLHGDVAF